MFSKTVFSLKNPSYSTVVELDRSLIEWKHNLPSFFKLEKRMSFFPSSSALLPTLDPC
jgi:hypothetical protein